MSYRLRRIKIVLTVNYYEGLLNVSDLEDHVRLLDVPAMITKVAPDYCSTEVSCNDCGAWLHISPRGACDHTHHFPECKHFIDTETSDDA